jgi:transcriptional regulator with XRE-family HTH domain
VSERVLTDAERTRQQGERLKRLREELKVSKGRLMDAVGLKTTNGYDLYERGVTAIRLNQVAEWAAAFGISEQEFVAKVLALPEPAADIRKALYAMGYKADEAPVVEKITMRLLEMSPRQRSQALILMQSAVEADLAGTAQN